MWYIYVSDSVTFNVPVYSNVLELPEDAPDISVYIFLLFSTFAITVRGFAEHGIAMASRLSVRPSVCNVEVSWSHGLEYFEKIISRLISLGCIALC